MNPPSTAGGLNTGGAAEFKSCCAEAYSADWIPLLLGESFHPGGLDLTHRLASALEFAPGARVLDVASGRGTSALAVAESFPVEVCGVDLSTTNIEAANAAAAARGVLDRVSFHLGDAEALPVDDAGFDAVICECALCTFPDKVTAVAEMARVLRPGGVLGISDVTADADLLPDRLRGWAARIACIGAAGRAGDYVDLLTSAGFEVQRVEHHNHVLGDLVDRIEARLLVLTMLARSGAVPPVDRAEVATVIAEVRAAIADGNLGYALFVARLPDSGTTSAGTGSGNR